MPPTHLPMCLPAGEQPLLHACHLEVPSGHGPGTVLMHQQAPPCGDDIHPVGGALHEVLGSDGC